MLRRRSPGNRESTCHAARESQIGGATGVPVRLPQWARGFDRLSQDPSWLQRCWAIVISPGSWRATLSCMCQFPAETRTGNSTWLCTQSPGSCCGTRHSQQSSIAGAMSMAAHVQHQRWLSVLQLVYSCCDAIAISTSPFPHVLLRCCTARCPEHSIRNIRQRVSTRDVPCPASQCPSKVTALF